MISNAKILLYSTRNDYVDNCYYGSIYLANKNGIYYFIGNNPNEIAFMRSLAKPLQTASIVDYDIIKDYKLTPKEIAIFCASHAGSPQHLKILKKLIKKLNIKIKDFELEAQEPLDKRKYNGKKSKLYNNCSGKHLMMLSMCKYLGFDFKNYTKENHPIQKIIHNKQKELSGFNSNILTYDGCSTPLWGLSYENIINAYFELFHNPKYKVIINSIINNPYIYGGYDRLDSEIIQLSKKRLFCKVGAGGFVLIYNFEKDEILLVKLTQNNNPIRKLIVMDALNKLNWLNSKLTQYEYNQKKQKVAKYYYEFNL